MSEGMEELSKEIKDLIATTKQPVKSIKVDWHSLYSYHEEDCGDVHVIRPGFAVEFYEDTDAKNECEGIREKSVVEDSETAPTIDKLKLNDEDEFLCSFHSHMMNAEKVSVIDKAGPSASLSSVPHIEWHEHAARNFVRKHYPVCTETSRKDYGSITRGGVCTEYQGRCSTLYG